MKTKIIYAFIALISAAVMSCDEDSMVKMNADVSIDPESSETAVVLTEAGAGTDVLTISWPEPEYGFDAAATYYIMLDKEGGDFSEPVVINNGSSITKTFKSEELNAHLNNLDFEPGVAAKLLVKVQSKLTANESIESDVIELDATGYQAFLDLSTVWGVVGGAYNNWGNTLDAPFFTTGSAGVIVCYVTLQAGEIKFRKNNDWGENLGDNGADGSLEANGSNIVVTAGPKKITFNTNNNTYTIESYSWGLVGSAWNNWGNGQGTPTQTVVPDLDFYYDDSSDTWKAIAKLTAGALKIRKNNDWGVNYGDNGGDGTLDAGGSDIVIANPGKYLITMDLNAMTYTIEPYANVWGLVGSAWNDWGGDNAPANGVQDKLDAQFVRDWRTDGVYELKCITLLAGEFKIRDGNDWGTNYGDTGANGSLELNGDNIVVTGGLYNVKIDFTSGTPTILVTKVP